MSLNMRRRDPREGGDDDLGMPSDLGAERIRQEAERLTSEGDATIDRMLSRDSLAFLTASPQHGGQ